MTHPRHMDPLPLGGAEGPPYSKGLMARALVAAGVSPVPAYELARRIEADLAARGETSLELDRLQELAVAQLGGEEGADVGRRMRQFRELQALDVPIILLVGGATGTGKSTVATEAAHRLGITRVTSTDFVRQTMRAFFSAEFMPSIHFSSFEAGRATDDRDDGNPALRGFLEQTRNVLVGVRAAIDRSLEEGWSMVLEGVHLVPGMLPQTIEGALVAQCVLAIDDEEEHAGHFWIRDASSEGVRPLEKYLDGFDEIRTIQRYIVERAHKAGVPVVDNGNLEQAIRSVIDIVLARAASLQRVEWTSL